MLKQYEPKKDALFGIVFFACPLLAWFAYTSVPHVALLIVAVVTSVFFMWVWYGTVYRMDGEYFYFKCGPFQGNVSVKQITQIECSVRSWSGMRPALSFNYMLIRYNDYDAVFIAPRDEMGFIRDMLSVNPSINVAARPGSSRYTI